jgi:hypothetical protein
MDSTIYWGLWDFGLHNSNTTDYWFADKSFLMASRMVDYTKTERGMGVSRFDTLANLQDVLFLNKEGIYNHIAHKQAMAYADEGSIYVTGYHADYWDCADPDSIELYVIDTALNQLAYMSLGGDASYDAFGVLTAKNNGAIIYGMVHHGDDTFCNSNLVIYYVSRDDLGLPPVAVFDRKSPSVNTKVYPNPSSGLIHIQVNKELLKDNSRVKIFNPYGRKVYDYQLPNKGNTLQLDITNLEEGVYVYQITNGENIVSTGKFIKN